MKTEQKQLHSLIKWISEQKDIPLQTRRDFFRHLKEQKSLDEKSVKFIRNYLEKRKQQALKNEKYFNDLETKLIELQALESNPETSLRIRIENEATNLMQSLSHRFVSLFRFREKLLSQKIESAEELENSAQIARLKAAL